MPTRNLKSVRILCVQTSDLIDNIIDNLIDNLIEGSRGDGSACLG